VLGLGDRGERTQEAEIQRGAVRDHFCLSARHVLVAAAAVALGLALLARGRPVLAALAFVVGLLGSEAGLAGPIFWASAALFGPRRRREVLAPVALIAVYLVAYHLAGGGARASGAYHDPLADPLGFAAIAAVRVPVLLADALLGVPSELALGGSEPPLALVGLGALLLVGFLFVCSRPNEAERATLRWLVPGALGALVVGCTGLPFGRVLMLPDLGFAALLGVLLHRGFAAAGPARVARAAGTALLVVQHMVVAPVANLVSLARLHRVARGIDRVAATAEIDAPPARRVFVVGASDPAVYLYPRGVLAWDEPRRTRCFLPLSGARSSHRLTRVDDRSFTLEALDRPLLDGSFDQLFRAPDRPFTPGDTVRSCGATIRVADVDRGRPRRLEVDLGAGAELLQWKDGRLQRLALPPPGESVVIPWEPGPSRVF